MIPRQNLILPVGKGIFLRLVGTQLLKPKKVTFFYMQPLHFLSVHLLLPVKEKHSRLSEIQCIYLCIYMKCDAGRILLPETLDALGLEPFWNQLEPFVHDSVSIFPNFMEMYHWASPAAVRGLVDVMSEWHNVRNGRIPPAKSISGLLPWLSASPVQQCHTRRNWLSTYSTVVKFCSLKPNQSKSLCFFASWCLSKEASGRLQFLTSGTSAQACGALSLGEDLCRCSQHFYCIYHNARF